MPQFDVFANPIAAARRNYPYVVVLQSDFLAVEREQIVAPLAPRKFLVHIPVDGERGFQRIVNADSKRT